VENGEHHRLTLSKEFDREARFSPDGRSLAFVRGLSNSTDLYVLNLDASMRASGDPRRLTTDGLRHHSPQWLGNGRELVFTMGVFGAGSIGRIAAAGGRVRRVTTIDAPGGIAVSPRSNRLLISRSTSDLDIYRVELSPDGVAQTPAQSPVPVIASSQYDTDPVYSPNGEKIAFASLRSGEWQIWLCDKDGTNSIQLTRLKGGEVHPTSWRPADGRQIGFLHNGDGTMRAYMVAVGGGIPERVPELASVASPVESFWWSPNGSWVVYTTPDGVWKMPTKGDTPVKLGVGGGLPAFSGGGVLAIVGQESGVGTWHNVPLDGGASQPTGLTTRRTRPDSGDFRTSISRADGPQGLYVAGNPTPTSAGPILLLRWPNGPFSRITGADASGYGLSLSPNGRTLLYTRFASAGADLVLVENFK
jgi:Tol biopolymer transport system component